MGHGGGSAPQEPAMQMRGPAFRSPNPHEMWAPCNASTVNSELVPRASWLARLAVLVALSSTEGYHLDEEGKDTIKEDSQLPRMGNGEGYVINKAKELSRMQATFKTAKLAQFQFYILYHSKNT